MQLYITFFGFRFNCILHYKCYSLTIYLHSKVALSESYFNHQKRYELFTGSHTKLKINYRCAYLAYNVLFAYCFPMRNKQINLTTCKNIIYMCSSKRISEVMAVPKCIFIYPSSLVRHTLKEKHQYTWNSSSVSPWVRATPCSAEDF